MRSRWTWHGHKMPGFYCPGTILISALHTRKNHGRGLSCVGRFNAYFNKLEILKVVFELEADESDGLSPRESSSEIETVLWNGLNLAKCYYLLLTDQKEKKIETANELLAYPYRSNEIRKSICQHIIAWYMQSEEKETLSIDKHILWWVIWF